METTTRPRNSPPAPPPKPKSKLNGSDHQQTSYEHGVDNNNVENYHQQNIHNNNYTSSPPSDEQVVMTPKAKTSNSTVILIERKLVEEVSDRVHVAGGDHRGIIINKDTVKGNKSLFTSFAKSISCIYYLFRSKIRQSCATSNT